MRFYIHMQRDKLHTFQASCNVKWMLMTTVNLAEQLLLTCTVHSSSINMRSIILLHIIKHEIIDFIYANIRYGFNRLLISLPRWNECWRFPTELICRTQSTLLYKHVAHWEPKSDSRICKSNLPKIVFKEVGGGVDMKLRPT
jgi:hypothetical protein